MKTFLGWALAAIATAYAGYLGHRVTQLEARLDRIDERHQPAVSISAAALKGNNAETALRDEVEALRQELRSMRSPRFEPLGLSR